MTVAVAVAVAVPVAVANAMTLAVAVAVAVAAAVAVAVAVSVAGAFNNRDLKASEKKKGREWDFNRLLSMTHSKVLQFFVLTKVMLCVFVVCYMPHAGLLGFKGILAYNLLTQV